MRKIMYEDIETVEDNNYTVIIELPYYSNSDSWEDGDISTYKLNVQAQNVNDAEKAAKRFINARKRSKNGVAWQDAKISAIK